MRREIKTRVICGIHVACNVIKGFIFTFALWCDRLARQACQITITKYQNLHRWVFPIQHNAKKTREGVVPHIDSIYTVNSQSNIHGRQILSYVSAFSVLFTTLLLHNPNENRSIDENERIGTHDNRKIQIDPGQSSPLNWSISRNFKNQNARIC